MKVGVQNSHQGLVKAQMAQTQAAMTATQEAAAADAQAAEKQTPLDCRSTTYEISEEAWQSPQDLVSFGFQQSRVLMMNENHDGMTHCPRTRKVGLSVIPSAHGAGCRMLAMEALSEEMAEEFNESRRVDGKDGYFVPPDLAAMAQSALDLGWQLAAYDSPGRPTVAEREMGQARNLKNLVSELEPDKKMMVWVGNSHHCEVVSSSAPHKMGYYFKQMSGIDPFTIDQSLTTLFPGVCPSLDWKDYEEPLAAFGGHAGFLAANASAPLNDGGHDAYILSVDNEFVG